MVEIMSMNDAAAVIRSGDTLALGGMMMYRRPMAFVRALVARYKSVSDLTLMSFTCGMGADLLVGAGMVRRTRTCYFGLESFGLAPMFTAAAQQGQLEIWEETEASLAMGLRATMAGVGFMPARAWLGTDLPALRPDVKTIEDPYSGETLMAFPAIHVDVAVIHALVADRFGNARLNNNLAIDFELSLVADTVIITAEKVVDKLSSDVQIPGVGVNAVVEAPHGAWPTSCYPNYIIAGGEVLRYIDACNAGAFQNYIEMFIVDPHETIT